MSTALLLQSQRQAQEMFTPSLQPSILAEPLIGEAIASFVKLTITRMGTSLIQDAANQGKRLTFEDTPDITAVQYVALMDNTCAFCEALDGLIIDTTTAEGRALEDKYSPAQHINCECEYVGIYKDEKYKADNKDFEKKWQAKFRKQNPGLKDMPKAEIVNKFGHYNLWTRGEHWVDEPGFDLITQEVMRKKMKKKVFKFVGDVAKFFGFGDITVPDWWV